MVTAEFPPTSTSPTTAVVLAGGVLVDEHLAAHDLPARLPDDAVIIAADSGLEVATRLGLRVDLVVGDLDSADPAQLAAATDAGAQVRAHPAAKDATDLELALREARDTGASRVVMVGGYGGRTDHLLAGALLLGAEQFADVEVVAHLGPATLTVVRGSASLHGRPGEYVSLLALHGPARGIVTDGLLYPLEDEDLVPGSTRGVSNELARPTAHLALRAGVLLAVQPGELGTHLANQGAPPS